jgi:Ca2+-binding EF-hand superfamily protein
MATSLISKHISEDELEKIFKEIDYNHDGYITP